MASALTLDPIDHSYRKDTMHPARWGYQARGQVAPSSVIIHTTNNKNRNTSFAKEAEFLRDSPLVSAHFLIGKDGRIVQFLDPVRWQAWHAGDALPAFLNAKSIGVEHHVSVGEAWTDAQHEACTALVRMLMAAHRISPELVDTHRAVALPKKRKSDPAGWDDASFYAWRATLVSPPPTPRYKAKMPAPVFEDRRPDAPAWGYIDQWKVEEMDDLTRGWLHLKSGIGFSPVSCWELA